MDRVDFTFDEYQANVLRTANRKLDWAETVENCLLGLIGELSEVITDLKPDSPLLQQVAKLGVVCEYVKKVKYHGKEVSLLASLDYDNLQLAQQAMKEVTFTPDGGSNLPKETGDVLYYLAWLVDTLGYELSDVAQQNVEKLRKRYATGFSVKASLSRVD